MNPIKIASISLLAFVITACGGSGSPTDTTTTTDGTTTPVPTDSTGSGGAATITSIDFGSGFGESFLPGAITLSNSYSLLAGTLQVSVDVVNKNDSNNPVLQAYQFEFSSTCSEKSPAEASFSVSTIGSNSGKAATTYRNISCHDSDTLTVNLMSQDGTQQLASATAVIPAYVPQLGFGSGPEYVDEKINGESILLNSPSSVLTANAVDIANINSLISDDAYTAIWRSSCVESRFSITTQTLSSGSLVTRYDANSCVGVDNITLTVYATNNLQIVLDTISLNVQIGPVVDNSATPALSELTISNEYVLAGSSIDVAVKGIDSNNNSLLMGDYKYQFITGCAVGTESFESILVEASAGVVTNIFNNNNCVVNNDTTLTVNLFESGADVAIDAPLDTLSTTFKTAYPELGFGSGADFVAGKIEGTTNLIGETSTKLTVNAVDTLNANSLISSNNYVAQWSAVCSAARFSIDSQSLSTANIVTRYDANSCMGNDIVTVKLFAKNDLSTELNSTTLALTIGSGASIDVDAKLTDIMLSSDHALAGESLTLNITGIDAKNGNESLTDNYVYAFESSCSGTSFDQTSVQSSTGDVTNTYRNTQCGAIGSSAIDTLTVNLYDASDLAFTTVLDTKSIIINTSYPKLGFGRGADFVSGKINGATNLIDEASTILTVNAVDLLNLNSLISSNNYVAQWSAACPAARFSIDSQSLSTANIVTRYDANSCTGNDTVTVKLFSKNDLLTELNSTTLILTIGTGVSIDVDAKLTDIILSRDHALAGESLVLNISGIDAENGDELLTDNYVYSFQSSCSGTSFAQTNVQSSTGDVSNIYSNTQCGAIGIDATDTLTVNLYDASDLVFSTVLDTKTITINTSYPKVGFGVGADFVDSLISGQSVLTSSLSSNLTANAVDRLDLNSRIRTDNYVVKWSSSCANSTFSIASQPISTDNIETRYDANTCIGSDTVTLSLYAKNDLATILDTASIMMNIGQSAGVEVESKLGFGNGSDFSEGQIKLSADYVLAGSSVTIIVNGVNIKDNNALLSGNYLYKFESNCANTSFSSNEIASNGGIVNNTYFNRQCQTADTITVTLFAEGTDTNTGVPLATATGTIETALPEVGSKSRADFIEGVIEGNTNLVDSASTLLSATIVDPLNVNTLLSSKDYYVEWQSNCGTAKFSIASQNILTAIETRYDGDADQCPTDVVTLTLFNKSDDSLSAITADITINESLIPAEPALGREVGVGFVSKELSFSQTNIAARQTIEVAVNIVDITAAANTLITDTEYAVKFNSVCVRDDRSSFDKELVRTTSGIAKVYYTASGCTGSDTINAVLYAVDNNAVDESSSLAVASGAISIELPEVNSIEYQGMTSRQIALQGISFTALPEVTEVSFIVKDIYNKPVSGKDVTFNLSNASVDATLSGDLDNSGDVVATTNAEGLVTAYVNSGQTHGLVSVLAVTDKNAGGVLRTQSFGISITTGIPVQPSFSLALNKYNPRGWNVNGTPVEATVQLADRFHNPVPDGTIVNFTTDGGYIEPTCMTTGGTCTATWTSGNPRPGFNKDNSQGVLQKSKTQTEHPTNDPTSQFHFNKNAICGSDDTAAACDPYRKVEVDSNWNGGRSGVVTILAYVEGEVDFADTNGSGRFDDAEAFSAMPEAYLDANEDGQYTAPDENNPFEQLIEYVEDEVMTAAPATYQGGSCTDAARVAGHCASLVHLRQEVRLIMSSDEVAFKVESITGGSSGDLSAASCINVFKEKAVTFTFSVNDYNGNTPIKGTDLTLTSENFDVDQAPGLVLNSNKTEALLIPVTIRTGVEISSDVSFITLAAAHPDGGIAGSITIENITENSQLKIATTDYLMDVANAANAQIVEFKFTDACGNPPGDSDILIFAVDKLDLASYDKSDVFTTDPITNVKTTGATPTDRSDSFQINANQLTSDGVYRIRLSNPDPTSAETEGTLTVRALNVSAGGIEPSPSVHKVKMK